MSNDATTESKEQETDSYQVPVAKSQVVTSTPQDLVPPLSHALPIDQWSVDEGRRLGYCR